MRPENTQLADLAEITSGFQFRGAIKADISGSTLAIQMSNVVIDSPIPWPDLVPVELPKGSRPKFIQNGDLLFTARGKTNFAVVCHETPTDRPVVASQHFFLIRTIADHILPEFIAWQLNQQPIQRELSIISDGSTQKSIPLRELKTVSIVVPDLEKQRVIISLHEQVIRQQAALKALIANRSQLMSSIAHDLATHTQSESVG